MIAASTMIACMLILPEGASVAATDVATQQKVVSQAKAAVEVPFELLPSLHMAVQVKLDGAGPFRLIFDLGAPINLVSGKAAAEAGLISDEAAKKPAFFGMRGQGKAERFEVGPAVALDIPVMIMDHPTIKAASEVVGPLDGIVGYPFFARYRFTIDYQKKIMSLEPSDYKPLDVMQLMMKRMFSSTSQQVISSPGVWGLELDEPAADGKAGMVVTRIMPGSAASESGLQKGDRILTINKRWTDTIADATDAASFVQPGMSATLEVQRGEERVDLQLTPRLGL